MVTPSLWADIRDSFTIVLRVGSVKLGLSKHWPNVIIGATPPPPPPNIGKIHYNDVKMSTMASQTTSLTIAYSTVYSGADQRKHQSSASLAFVRGIHRWPVNSPHKGPITRKIFPFHEVITRPLWSNNIVPSNGEPCAKFSGCSVYCRCMHAKFTDQYARTCRCCIHGWGWRVRGWGSAVERQGPWRRWGRWGDDAIAAGSLIVVVAGVSIRCVLWKNTRQ